MVFAEVLIFDAIAQHVVGGDELTLPDSHDRSFPAATPGQAMILAGEVASLSSRRRSDGHAT